MPKAVKKITYLCVILASIFCTGCSNLFYQPSRGLYVEPKTVGQTPEDVWFKSEDGTKLYGWYFSSGKQPKALVLYFHGNAENLSSHYVSLLWILKHNVDFFIFSYQGYGRSEGSPNQEATINDGKAAIRLAKARAEALKIPLVVLGQSLGSAISLRSMIELKPAAILIDSGFSSYQAVANEFMSRSWIGWPLQWLAYLLVRDTYAPGKRISELAGIPILVIHGDADKVVKYQMGEKLFTLAGEPKQFLRVVGGEHIDVFGRENGHYRKPIIEFLEHSLHMPLPAR
jgi:fermentation-respiration switch protein FrsA (DUF1100 family)